MASPWLTSSGISQWMTDLSGRDPEPAQSCVSLEVGWCGDAKIGKKTGLMNK